MKCYEFKYEKTKKDKIVCFGSKCKGKWGNFLVSLAFHWMLFSSFDSTLSSYNEWMKKVKWAKK